MGNRITLDELLAIARRVQKLHLSEDCDAVRMANGIDDLLGESEMCGFVGPEVLGSGRVSFDGAIYEPDGARNLARMLLRSADEAEQK